MSAFQPLFGRSSGHSRLRSGNDLPTSSRACIEDPLHIRGDTQNLELVIVGEHDIIGKEKCMRNFSVLSRNAFSDFLRLDAVSSNSSDFSASLSQFFYKLFSCLAVIIHDDLLPIIKKRMDCSL